VIANDTAIPGRGIGIGKLVDKGLVSRTIASHIGPNPETQKQSVRPVDLLVSEMAVIAFPDGRATLLETGPGVTVEQVVAATEAKLALPDKIPEMTL
jgi:acyl CoA:acetate/3-ketoacid CoA transferase beta subunit